MSVLAYFLLIAVHLEPEDLTTETTTPHTVISRCVDTVNSIGL